jgi:hypothetical protein
LALHAECATDVIPLLQGAPDPTLKCTVDALVYEHLLAQTQGAYVLDGFPRKRRGRIL